MTCNKKFYYCIYYKSKLRRIVKHEPALFNIWKNNILLDYEIYFGNLKQVILGFIQIQMFPSRAFDSLQLLVVLAFGLALSENAVCYWFSAAGQVALSLQSMLRVRYRRSSPEKINTHCEWGYWENWAKLEEYEYWNTNFH